MIHDAGCRLVLVLGDELRVRDCSCGLPARPMPHELRRVRELAFEAGVPVPSGIATWTRPQVRVTIARLAPLARRERLRLRGVAV